jgi:hypothetical protein
MVTGLYSFAVGMTQAVSKGGPATRLRIMTMEELEEMEPGFTTRSDEEWERIFYKKKRFSASDRRRNKTKSKKFGKKAGPRWDSNSNPREYEREIGPDPPRPGRHEPSSTVFS